eukprot:1333140-Lingulodinium_polyedra.AAC.1
MAQGIDEWFVCRRFDCLRVGLNTHWTHNAEHHPPLQNDGGGGAVSVPALRAVLPPVDGAR